MSDPRAIFVAGNTGEEALDSETLARTVVDLVVGKFAEDVLLLDIRPVSSFADYFVICQGATERQIEAIQEEILTKLGEMQVRPLHAEGTPMSGWMLLDYGGLVVHVFLPATRQYYDLEQLWKGAKTIVRIL